MALRLTSLGKSVLGRGLLDQLKDEPKLTGTARKPSRSERRRKKRRRRMQATSRLKNRRRR